MKRVIPFVWLLLGLCLSGCPESGSATDTVFSPDGALPREGGGDALVDRGGDGALPTDGAAPAVCTVTLGDGGQVVGGTVSGELQEPGGLPIAGEQIIICTEDSCFHDITGADGRFCIHVNEVGEFLFHALERQAGGKHYGDVLFPLTIDAADGAEPLDVGLVIQPLMGPVVPLDLAAGGTLALGSGASLTVPPGVTRLPPLSTGAAVALAAVPPAQLHPRLLGSKPGGGMPVAAFLVVPVGVTFTSPVSFVLPSSGLALETPLEVFWAAETTGKLESHAQARVNASGQIVDEGGQGITALGWLLFYTK